MVSRLLGYAVFAAMGWWLWSGPLQDWRSVSVEEQMQANDQNMARCLRSKEYVAGSTGAYVADPEAQCAKRYNLYRHEGHWYSYDKARGAG